jgi:hypothetical protein
LERKTNSTSLAKTGSNDGKKSTDKVPKEPASVKIEPAKPVVPPDKKKKKGFFNWCK